MNKETQPSEKARERLICHRIMMQLFSRAMIKGRGFRLSQGFGKCRQGHFLSTKEIVEVNSEEKVYRLGLDILGMLSLQVTSSVFGNVYFRSSDSVQTQSGFDAFFRCVM